MRATQIKKARANLKWTQKRLADWMGVTVRTVQNWERDGCTRSVWLALQGIKR